MLKHICGIIAGKIVAFLIQKTSSGAGTNLPGKVALALSGDILNYLMPQVQYQNIVISGTNGKTTTSGLLASMIEAWGYSLLHNKKGANMLTGIVTATISQSSYLGKLKADYSIFEIDEAYYSKLVDFYANDLLIITNLFRDQLDRYGELDTTAKKIKEGIVKVSKERPLKIVLNADDPIVTSLYQEETNLHPLWFGIKNFTISTASTEYSPFELAACPCGVYYQYHKIYFGHIGHYYCPQCTNQTPSYDVWIEHGTLTSEGSVFQIKSKEGLSCEMHLNMPGLYNVYNCLGAVSAALSLNIPVDTIMRGIDQYKTVFGRSEITYLQGKKVIIQLIKNPIGASEVLKTLTHHQARILIGINDNYADGKDVSWLWDTDFELLKNHSKQIICSGSRGYDIALRLIQAGIKEEHITVINPIQEALIEALRQVNTDDQEVLYILPTYTVLLDMQKFIHHIK